MISRSNLALSGGKGVFFIVAAVSALTVFAVYWPVLHAQFVWNDAKLFQQTEWVRYGDAWRHYIFHGYNDWTNYFRPLVVALFTWQVRAFNALPGPMHAVSLCLHVLDTLLVGLLASVVGWKHYSATRRWMVAAIPMLLYGLHPVLVEDVVWVGCQFDLVATCFMLLAIIANLTVHRTWLRAIFVASCFFLAACAKESAAALPFILVVFDWLTIRPIGKKALKCQIYDVIRRNWPVYAAIILAAVAYVLFRRWGMGSLTLHAHAAGQGLLERFQIVCFLYMRYWRLFFWPMAGMSPLHPIATSSFTVLSIGSLVRDVAAVCIVVLGVWLTVLRSYLGAIIAVVTFALLPVLHIVAADFDASLYHERYVMTALAFLASLLPLALLEIRLPSDSARTVILTSLFGFSVWLALSVVSIRQIVPLWSAPVPLWQWALQENPGYVGAIDELITAYIEAGDDGRAWPLINQMVQQNAPCAACFLNGANLALRQRNIDLASFYLDRLRRSPGLLAAQPGAYPDYLELRAEVLLLQNDPAKAEAYLRQFVTIQPNNPNPLFELATALALQGKTIEAQDVERAALALLPPYDRSKRHSLFLNVLKIAKPSTEGAKE